MLPRGYDDEIMLLGRKGDGGGYDGVDYGNKGGLLCGGKRANQERQNTFFCD